MTVRIAIVLPPEMTRNFETTYRRLGSLCEGSFELPEDYHLTMARVRAAGEGEVGEVLRALGEACEGRGPLTLREGELVRRRRSQEEDIWLSVERTSELAHLTGAVRERLGAHGLVAESRAFLPHVTIARRIFVPRGVLPRLDPPRLGEVRCVGVYVDGCRVPRRTVEL